MDGKRCGKCVFWVTNHCEGAPKPCKDYETYEDWDNLDSLIEEWRQ